MYYIKIFVISLTVYVAGVTDGTLSSPIDVSFLVGQTAKLPCVLQADVEKVQWKSESAGIISEDFRFLQGSERYSIEQPTRRDWNLVIRNVKFSDAGIYVCICYGTSTYEVVSHLIVRDFDVNLTSPTAITTPTTAIDSAKTGSRSSYKKSFTRTPDAEDNWIPVSSADIRPTAVSCANNIQFAIVLYLLVLYWIF